MLEFNCDYMEGAHPSILKRLNDINLCKISGYGEDAICDSAKEKIRKACGLNEAEIRFLVGGTQTNACAIRALLKPYQGVISASTGHINVHEAGAIEAGGHKVIALPNHDGKLDSGELEAYLSAFYKDPSYQHMVQPGMVYISHPSEYGTLYTKAELRQLHEVCSRYTLPLYLDGARLGYALAALDTDLSLKDIAELCDAFYIGGTKVGALFGEALVFPKMRIDGLTGIIKQSGALLAKGWLLGVQFDELFTDGLYYKLSANAIDKAEKLKSAMLSKGYRLFIDSPTNQQFVIMDNDTLSYLSDKVSYSLWESYDENSSVVRFATSWATTDEQLEELIALL